MVMTKFLIGAAALSAPLVAGHGYMGLPKVTFSSTAGDVTQFVAEIQSSQFTPPSGMSFSTDPTSNTKAYTAWIKTTDYTSLKDLITKKSTASVCGNTVLSDPQPLPDMVEWTHSSSEGFTASHEGPCEVWCDDKMAFHDDDCAKNYPAAPAKLPYDKSLCTGASKLTMYWLALHSSAWQVYINCAALSGATSSGSTSSGSASTTPAATTATPTSTTATPTSTTATPTVTPTSTTSTPSSTTSAPSPSSGSEDCDEDLPEPSGSEDCDEDLPEPNGSAETGADADITTSNINFSTYQGSAGEDSPGKVSTNTY